MGCLNEIPQQARAEQARGWLHQPTDPVDGREGGAIVLAVDAGIGVPFNTEGMACGGSAPMG